MHDDGEVSNVTKCVLCRVDLSHLPERSSWLERPLHTDYV